MSENLQGNVGIVAAQREEARLLQAEWEAFILNNYAAGHYPEGDWRRDLEEA